MDKSFKIEKDFYIRESEDRFTGIETITFNYPTPVKFEKAEYDWYIMVALEKADKVKVDRHLLSSGLLLKYRWAIREGYNHSLDPNLNQRWAHPRNKYTVQGIQGYIDRITKASDDEMKNLEM